MRGQAKLGWTPADYESILERKPSPWNKLELCLGTIAEMPDNNIYDLVDRVARREGICYIHFRNVIGSAPNYREVFIDEGEIDMEKIIGILLSAGYTGVLIPDHTPQMSCEATWHAGMAYAMGYMNALIGKALSASE